MNIRGILAGSTLVIVAGQTADAQSLANRVSAVRDGKVRMTFAARDGICGFHNGISTRPGTRNTWSRDRSKDVEYDVECSEGPARVVVDMSGGQPVALRAYVGGQWRAASGVTDVGTVGTREVTGWLLAVAGRGSSKVASSAIFATTLADSVDMGPALYDFARDETKPVEARGHAIFWMSQAENPEHLRGLYSRVRGEALKDKVIFAISQQKGPESEKWLLDLVSNKSEPIEMRKKALFWAGQGGTPTAMLASLYSKMTERDMKDQMIFALSQRRDAAAIDKLMDIARNDADREARRKAMFWLGQSKDPRVASMLLDIINQ